MQALACPSRLSVEDYLAGEETSEVKHEYIGGEVYAMTGASRAHRADRAEPRRDVAAAAARQ